MTDNEIIKALEFCEENKDNCFTCPVRDDCMRRDMPFIGWALELIKSQKAEIERLNKEVDRLSQCLLYNESFTADFVKEFVAEIVREYPEAEYYINDLCKTYGGVFE